VKLNYEVKGEGDPVVFLHGMAGSLRYWQSVIEQLPSGFRCIALDLLGYGHSPKPDTGYTTAEHVDSIKETLDTAGINGPFTLVGFSMGALLAAAYAHKYPQDVQRLVLISLPVYKGQVETRKYLTADRIRTSLLYYGLSSRLVCKIMCQWLRPITGRLVIGHFRNMPPYVAEDSLLHTWQSYSRSRDNVIAGQDMKGWLSNISARIDVVIGERDRLMNRERLDELAKVYDGFKIQTMPGGHHLPVDHPDKIAKIIEKARP
jgi:pimeloyl-ACP methyl ester carboxylesterase